MSTAKLVAWTAFMGLGYAALWMGIHYALPNNPWVRKVYGPVPLLVMPLLLALTPYLMAEPQEPRHWWQAGRVQQAITTAIFSAASVLLFSLYGHHDWADVTALPMGAALVALLQIYPRSVAKEPSFFGTARFQNFNGIANVILNALVTVAVLGMLVKSLVTVARTGRFGLLLFLLVAFAATIFGTCKSTQEWLEMRRSERNGMRAV